MNTKEGNAQVSQRISPVAGRIAPDSRPALSSAVVACSVRFRWACSRRCLRPGYGPRW